jgi:phage shock protein E
MRWLTKLVILCLALMVSQLTFAQEIETQKGLDAIAKGAVVIDVRTGWEWSSGHHPKALHMQNTLLLEKIKTLNLDKNSAIVLYCRSGKRAAQSTKDLQAAGYTNVINAGGLKDVINVGDPKDD